MDLLELVKVGDFDCAPVLEGIIGQTYIYDLWVYSNANQIIFSTSVYRQFVGTMHAGTDQEVHYSDGRAGWIEDGTARKGDTVAEAAFETYEEAVFWVNTEIMRLMQELYGSLQPESFAV